MHGLDLTAETPAENLALDEMLLDQAEAHSAADGGPESPANAEVLRVWEPRQNFVVVGRSTNIEQEVDVAACRTRGLPIVRRPSGGAAIVTGPGCYMYSLVLSYRRRPELRFIDRVHAYVAEAIVTELAKLIREVARAGTSDLAWQGKKFSGNSVRCKREHVLYHGTLLYDFPLDLIGAVLKLPPRQPDYRQARPHADFVTNLPLPVAELRDALCRAFAVTELTKRLPL
ncbi:MAG TPA: lipoate--protein ligase family protein [Pirellulales bacterium]|jgi:lipoate-protein ligase A|nr:lipoate--protein ligase family protein [Pirellulales bacterium]